MCCSVPSRCSSAHAWSPPCSLKQGPFGLPAARKVSGNVNLEAISVDDADAAHPNQYTPNLSLLAATLSPYVESEIYP